MTDANSGEGTK